MAVGAAYLAKIQRAVRLVSPSAAITAELTDTVEECRADLGRLGLPTALTASETDFHILDAVKRYARWKFAADPYESARCADEYKEKADELRRMRDYAWLTITFTVQTSVGLKIPDALISFGGQSLYTDSLGVAVFYYISPGQNQVYTVSATGYNTVSVYLDVTASASVTVVMA